MIIWAGKPLRRFPALSIVIFRVVIVHFFRFRLLSSDRLKFYCRYALLIAFFCSWCAKIIKLFLSGRPCRSFFTKNRRHGLKCTSRLCFLSSTRAPSLCLLVHLQLRMTRGWQRRTTCTRPTTIHRAPPSLKGRPSSRKMRLKV